MEAILLQVILIGLNAVFASAEIAVISMNDTKLERMARDGDARAKRLAALTAQRYRWQLHWQGCLALRLRRKILPVRWCR